MVRLHHEGIQVIAFHDKAKIIFVPVYLFLMEAVDDDLRMSFPRDAEGPRSVDGLGINFKPGCQFGENEIGLLIDRTVWTLQDV